MGLDIYLGQKQKIEEGKYAPIRFIYGIDWIGLKFETYIYYKGPFKYHAIT